MPLRHHRPGELDAIDPRLWLYVTDATNRLDHYVLPLDDVEWSEIKEDDMNKRQRKKWSSAHCDHIALGDILEGEHATRCGRNGNLCLFCECKKYTVSKHHKHIVYKSRKMARRLFAVNIMQL